MPLTVTTRPSKTVFKFPDEPGLDLLYQAEMLRAKTQQLFWTSFIMLAVAVGMLAFGHAFGTDSQDVLRTLLFILAGSVAGRLFGYTRALRLHADAHAFWTDQVKDDPSWGPPED